VCLLSSTFKKSYYLVNAGSNTFTLTEGLNSVVVTIAVGNYGYTNFRAILQTLLNANSPSGFTYAVTIPNLTTSPSTGLYSYSVSGNAGVQPIISFSNASRVNELLGFATGSSNSFVGNALTSTQIVLFQLRDFIRIHTNIISDTTDNILAQFSALGSDFSTINYEVNDIEANSFPFKTKTNLLEISILDEDANLIGLNTNILLVLMVYKKNLLLERTLTNIQNYIQFKVTESDS
jgi:hypothetical protein